MEKKLEDKAESLQQSAVSSETIEKEGRIQWLHTDVQTLVNIVGEHWPDFQNGVRKKKYLWREIASKLSRDGFAVNGEECDRKWRNLKIRYLAVREKQMKGEKTTYRVDYFKRIHAFLKDDPMTEAYLRQRYFNNVNVKHGDIDEDDFSEITSDGNMVWTERSVDLLLNLLQEFKDWFSDKDSDRDDDTVWEAISQQMKLEGHSPGPEQCQRKWNNLALGFQHHKSEAEATGTLPLWPYYTRVRHIINSVNVPFSGSDSLSPIKRKAKGSSPGMKKRKITHFKQEIESLDDDLMEQPGDMTEGDEPSSVSGIEKRSSIADARSSTPLSGELRPPVPGELREVCHRLDRLEENIGICRRLDRLEAKLNDASQQHELQNQTNILLGQVLSELSRLSRNLTNRYQQGSSQESTDLGSGITIVVPNTNI